MENRHVCKHCEDSQIFICYDEHKEEELSCSFCPQPSECLYKGKSCCVSCRGHQLTQSRSRQGSIRSDKLNTLNRITPSSDNDSMISHSSIYHSPTNKAEKQVSTEFVKAHNFLQKYLRNSDMVSLYDSRKDGYSSRAFHSKCEDSKGGLIILIVLKIGYAVAGFTWKGIRRSCKESLDVQAGGAIIKENAIDFVSFSDQVVFNENEGIRFSRASDLYINFDDLESSICKFDRKLAHKDGWTSWIKCILAYKLQ